MSLTNKEKLIVLYNLIKQIRCDLYNVELVKNDISGDDTLETYLHFEKWDDAYEYLNKQIKDADKK